MAIHPRFAEAILAGHKQVEFRKRALAPDVNTVLLYATAPVQRIVGECTVERTLLAAPQELWDQVGHVGGVDQDTFRAYYARTDAAVGFAIAGAFRYPHPVPLSALDPKPVAPQSFSYLPVGTLQVLRRLGGSPRTALLGRLVSGITNLIQILSPHQRLADVIPVQLHISPKPSAARRSLT